MTTIYKNVEVEVDIDIDDVIEDLDDKARGEVLRKLQGYFEPATEDPGRTDRIIETAYLRARAMADLPRGFADLLWHVHGRAI